MVAVWRSVREPRGQGRDDGREAVGHGPVEAEGGEAFGVVGGLLLVVRVGLVV